MTFRLTMIRQSILLILSGVALTSDFPSFSSAAQPPFAWRWSHPAPHGNHIADMVETNGFYVQVSERGQIHTSDDFQTWLSGQSHTTNALRAVTFFGNRIVAVGENGTVVYGDAADRLQSVSLNTTDWLEGIAASPALLIGVGIAIVLFVVRFVLGGLGSGISNAISKSGGDTPSPIDPPRNASVSKPRDYSIEYRDNDAYFDSRYATKTSAWGRTSRSSPRSRL
jgi:hypothetical protein